MRLYLSIMTVTLAASAVSAVDFQSVPDLKPFAAQAYGVRKVTRKDASTLEVVLGASASKAKELPESWRITSTDDPDYAYSKFVKPTGVRVVEEKVEFAYPEGRREVKKASPELTRTVLALSVPSPLKDGAKYSVVAMGKDIEPVTCARTGCTEGGKDDPDGFSDRVVGLRRVSSVGDGKLLCEFGAGYSPAGGYEAKNWTVKVNGLVRPIVAMGRRTKLDFYRPSGWGQNYTCLMGHDVFVDLGSALEKGAKVSVEVSAAVTAGAREASFTFDEAKSVTRSIQVNQVGYLPDAPKFAYVGCWFGSMPDDRFVDDAKTGGGDMMGAAHTPFYEKELDPRSLRFNAAPAFEVVDVKTGRAALKGKAKLTFVGKEKETKKLGFSAMNVWEIDFSKVKKAGKYYIRIPGVGRSFAFRVDKDVYADAFKVQARGIYAQRCGCPMDPQITRGWERISCHDKGVTATDLPFGGSWGELPKHVEKVNGEPMVLLASGGHHDAGDYNPRSHLDVAQAILYLCELKPSAFTDSQLEVPERGNGIPDVLDEALWQLKLWKGLQQEDGSVRHGTESRADPNFCQTVELDDLGDYAWAKSVLRSYDVAAAFAQVSRLLKKCGQSAEAEDYLVRAKKAYDWGEQNADKPADDNRAAAAVSLYHSTGDNRYLADAKELLPWARGESSALTVWKQYDLSAAAYQYLLLPEEMRESATYDLVVKACQAEFAEFSRGSDSVPYKILRNSYAPITWGTGAYENYCVTAAFLYALKGDDQCRYWLVRTCDNTLGANPLGLSWITGLGQRTIRCPLHNSRYRAAGVPVEGLQAQGPNQTGAGYHYNDTVFPRHLDTLACLHEFADVHFAIAMDEPTVNNMANTLLVFGVLAK